jgi:hypothetical protein
MRRMSFAITKQQIQNKTKTVTRRNGWKFLKAGDMIQPVEKCMGLKKGQKQVKIGEPIVIQKISFERLDMISNQDVTLEGFPDKDASWFIEMYCKANRCTPDTKVTRIEFYYTENLTDLPY